MTSLEFPDATSQMFEASADVSQITTAQTVWSDWEAPEPPSDLIFDDGEPLESNRHRIAMNVLIDSMLWALRDRRDVFAGGNMFVYYSCQQAMNRDLSPSETLRERGPDFFVVLDVEGDRERQGWVVWEEDGRYPDVIVELMSPSTMAVDLGVKKDLYAQIFRTSTYVVYNPFDPKTLQGWQLDISHRYQPLTLNEQGWLWYEPLELWLGLWQGTVRREPPVGGCDWLRFYDRDGNLIPLLEEVAQQAQQQAEQERLRADQAQEQAKQAQQQAEQERQRAKQLAARLRELGIEPEMG